MDVGVSPTGVLRLGFLDQGFGCVLIYIILHIILVPLGQHATATLTVVGVGGGEFGVRVV